MNFRLIVSSSFVLLSLIITSCNIPRLYYNDDPKHLSTGKLSDTTYGNLKQILQAASSSPLNDTLFIKYEYNKETCWNLLDREEDSYIQPIVDNKKLRIAKTLADRKQISIFTFREPGNNLNKIIKLDDSIIIDENKYLFKLLFSKRAVCGCSIIIMPDRRYILEHSDSHFLTLNMTKEEIDDILSER